MTRRVEAVRNNLTPWFLLFTNPTPMHFHFRGLIRFALLFSLPFFYCRCTPKQIASDITAQIFQGGSPAFEMESDIELSEQTGLTMIKMLEAFQHDNPHNKTYLVLLSRSYANYSFG